MDEFVTFLNRYQPLTQEPALWDDLQLHITSYQCAELPPDALITSVRAIVCDRHHILIVRDPERMHILPGGRRELGETLMQTLRREVLEETGWEIDHPTLLGIKHFHHLSAKPRVYPYPYPDFVHAIYHAIPWRYQAQARQIDGYELEAGLVPLAEFDQETVSLSERLFLRLLFNSW
jgi:ADP-ribose pyrophosphatase YjhB (NUDIX family)